MGKFLFVFNKELKDELQNMGMEFLHKQKSKSGKDCWVFVNDEKILNKLNQFNADENSFVPSDKMLFV